MACGVVWCGVPQCMVQCTCKLEVWHIHFFRVFLSGAQPPTCQISGGVCFTGSKAVSGVLLFAEASAFLG